MPGLELLVGPATGGVQTPGQDVGLDSLVPRVGQELLKLARKAVKLLGRELDDCGLKLFDAHELEATETVR